MKKASISEAKNQLSALIDSVTAGGAVLIVDRGRPVARLEAVTHDLSDGGDGRLARLVRAGLVKPGCGSIPSSLLRQKPPRAGRSASAVQALLDERHGGR
ncbi:MAG: type II toxin-antitoxin system Phd/YefM family antitoxin [Vicinamibacterales bacterium]